MNPARLVFPAVRWGDRNVEKVWREVRRDLDLGVGGFVVFGGSVDGMRELAARTQDREGRPVLFAADLERGAGQQLEGATPLPPALALASMDAAALLDAARITAHEAAAAGIGWVLAPVADLDVEPLNPIVGSRSFGSEPAIVAERVRAWLTTVQDEGIHACAKHFPGHGRTTADSHSELPTVKWTRETLEADMLPFRAAVAAQVASVMLAHVSYPALDPSGTPASLSRKIVRLLRAELGFDGLIASDALIMEAVTAAGRSETEAAVEAVRAGCDVLFYPSSPAETVAALRSALESKVLDHRQVARSVERIEVAARTADIAIDDQAPVSSQARALEMAAASLTTLRGALPHPRPGQAFRVHLVDDDVVELPETLAGPGTRSPERGRLAKALHERGAATLDPESEAPALDLVAVFSDVKGWKRRSWLAPERAGEVNRIVERAPDSTIVIFGHPRLARQLPGAQNVVCAWCGDPLMQEAVAEHLLGSPSG
ncbi:MAG: glycoside hydrolase family 3 N-terminal domain-containing protein [Gemmatimonadales bacterium]|jgi:beta-glucosidase